MDLSVLLSTILGGILSILGGYIQTRMSEKKQEEDRKTKLKVEVLIDIMGNRAALTGSTNSSLFTHSFFNAMNRINVTFNDNEEVLNFYEEFSRHALLPPDQKIGNTSNELFYKLIKSMYKDLDMVAPSYEAFVKTLY